MMLRSGKRLRLDLESQPKQPRPKPFPIDQLPKEILSIVLNNLEQNDVLRLRLVNKLWKSYVESFFKSWKIPLDDSCPYLEWMLDLHVKEVKLVKFCNPLPFRDPGVILKYPDNLQIISKGQNSIKCDLEGCTFSPQNLNFLLRSKNLKSAFLVIDMENLIEDVQLATDCPELKTLDLKLQSTGDPPGKPNFLEGLLLQTTFPQLRVLNISSFVSYYYREESLETCICQLLISFLAKTAETLRVFSYRWTSGRSRGDETLDNLKRIETCSSLESLELSIPASHLLFYPVAYRLLNCQTKLVKLHVEGEWPGKRAILFEAVRKNCETLTTITADCLGTGSLFDMKFFSKCVNLTTLDLKSSSVDSYFLSGVLAINLATLPVSLEFLNLGGYSSRSDEIEEFLKTHGNLRTLELICCERAEGDRGSI